MGLVLFVVVGAFTGWLTAAIEEVDAGIFARIGIGSIGALFGAILLIIFSGRPAVTEPSWINVLAGTIAAVVFLSLFGFVRKYNTHSSNRA